MTTTQKITNPASTAVLSQLNEPTNILTPLLSHKEALITLRLMYISYSQQCQHNYQRMWQTFTVPRILPLAILLTTTQTLLKPTERMTLLPEAATNA